MGKAINIGYILLPEHIDTALIDYLKSNVPGNLLSHINYEKEVVSLAHSLAGRYILNKLLHTSQMNIEDINLILSDYKRPILADSKWQFSISHSGRIATCALGYNMSLGIDIELMRQIEFEDFKYQFSASDYEAILTDKSGKEFYKSWTAKEAITKAIGKGLYIDMVDIQYHSDNIYMYGNNKWYINELDINENYSTSLATLAKNIKYNSQQFKLIE